MNTDYNNNEQLAYQNNEESLEQYLNGYYNTETEQEELEKVEYAYQEYEEYESTGRGPSVGTMLMGLLFFVGGLAITIITYNNASSGGRYYVCYGAIIWGLVTFFRGLAGGSSD